MDMTTIYEQLELPAPPPIPDTFIFRVACRVDGKLQGYQVEAKTYVEAFEIINRDLPDARAVLVLLN